MTVERIAYTNFVAWDIVLNFFIFLKNIITIILCSSFHHFCSLSEFFETESSKETIFNDILCASDDLFSIASQIHSWFRFLLCKIVNYVTKQTSTDKLRKYWNKRREAPRNHNYAIKIDRWINLSVISFQIYCVNY